MTNTASISCWTFLTSLSSEAANESSDVSWSSKLCSCNLVAWARLTQTC